MVPWWVITLSVWSMRIIKRPQPTNTSKLIPPSNQTPETINPVRSPDRSCISTRHFIKYFYIHLLDFSPFFFPFLFWINRHNMYSNHNSIILVTLFLFTISVSVSLIFISILHFHASLSTNLPFLNQTTPPHPEPVSSHLSFSVSSRQFRALWADSISLG